MIMKALTILNIRKKLLKLLNKETKDLSNNKKQINKEKMKIKINN